jgi:NAD(P)-dependent dehydrogenase (short-subunit alcohol dehydrogenase family)
MAGPLGFHSTAEEVLAGVDLSGKTLLVTGVSAGLGVETARAAGAHGARVIGTARDLTKGERALAAYADLGIELVECDLASLASVRACADALLARGEPIDVVIANAGVMNCPFGRTADGFETQFGTNHLGHFVLVNRLVSLIPAGGRIVMVSSRGHHATDVDLDDPDWTGGGYEPFIAYGRSKTANILFAIALDRRLKQRGIRATALQPGGIRTELLRHTTPEMLQAMAAASAERAGGAHGKASAVKSVEQGAATSIWAGFVASAEEVGGRYCEDCHVADVAESGGEGVRPYAVDHERAELLWALSERMVGEQFL